MARSERKAVDKVLVFLGAVSTAVFLVVGSLAWWGYDFASDKVRNELAAQKIYFPPKGTPALDPKDYPGLQQYAGQLVDSGPKAKAYADEFIGKHLEKVAGGKTYAEISSEAMKDPSNQKLQSQKQTLFQGETLRGLLLNAYAFGTFGTLAKFAAIAAFAGAAIMAVLVWLGLIHLARLK